MSKGNDDYKSPCWKCEGSGEKEDGGTCTHCSGRGMVQFAYPGRGMVGRNGLGEKDGEVRPYRTGKMHHE